MAGVNIKSVKKLLKEKYSLLMGREGEKGKGKQY